MYHDSLSLGDTVTALCHKFSYLALVEIRGGGERGNSSFMSVLSSIQQINLTPLRGLLPIHLK